MGSCLVAPIDITQNTTQGVREDTAELASWALSDIASHPNGHSPSRHGTASSTQPNVDDHYSGRLGQDEISRHDSNGSSRPDAILEVSEPASPQDSPSPRNSPPTSALTKMIRQSPPSEDGYSEDTVGETALRSSGVQPVTVGEGIISQPTERTALLLKRAVYGSEESPIYGSVQDLESQNNLAGSPMGRLHAALARSRAQTAWIVRAATNPKSWDRDQLWQQGIRRPASYVPPVMLGLLLNILDALSYGETWLAIC